MFDDQTSGWNCQLPQPSGSFSKKWSNYEFFIVVGFTSIIRFRAVSIWRWKFLHQQILTEMNANGLIEFFSALSKLAMENLRTVMRETFKRTINSRFIFCRFPHVTRQEICKRLDFEVHCNVEAKRNIFISFTLRWRLLKVQQANATHLLTPKNI